MKTIKTSKISKSPFLANIHIYHLVGQERPIRSKSFFSIELTRPNVTQTKLTIEKIFTFKIVLSRLSSALFLLLSWRQYFQ